MKNLTRFLLIFLSVVLVLAIALGVYLIITVRSSFPTSNGEIQLAGLNAPVDVYRDSYGIPHIYAASTHDLFFAQGYIHAQDRFWQMDFNRHVGSARISEMFPGADQLKSDIFLRNLGWARVARQELAAMDPETLNILQSYADGVNAYLADHRGGALSLEYAILGLLNSGYQVEPWQPIHTLTWAKAMSWSLGGNMDQEIARAILLKTLPLEQVNALYPPYPTDAPVIVPGFSSNSSAATGSSYALPADVSSLLLGLQTQISGLEAFTGPRGTGIGSNNWVIAGSRTNTGMPLLANDPHLGVEMPSIWYEVGLHCTPKSDSCPYEVAGVSFPGAPGVVIGHNDRIAWGMTNTGPDVQDLYIEKINPENPNQYEVNGEWVDMQTVQEIIHVAGDKDVTHTVRYTRHGPLIYSEESLKELRDEIGLALPENYAIALRWTALDNSHTFAAIWMLDRAKNWEEFRAAAAMFDVPAQNLVYADVDGNIGYQMPGRVPIRASGDGRLPVEGWTDAYEWTGFIPFEQLPYSFNPPQGYIVTANNAVVGADYPYLITTDWDYGYRARRIVEMIENAQGKIDAAYISQIQGDNFNEAGALFVPLLNQLTLSDARLVKARSLLTGWNMQNHMDSAAAALFEVFRKHLLAFTFNDELPEDYWMGAGARASWLLTGIISDPKHDWWDNKTTPAVESRDDILLKAFSAAVDELEKQQGGDPAKWNWGNLHTVSFIHSTFGASGIAPIEALFNRGPFRTSGGGTMPNATAWNAASGSYEVVWLPSMRMIVDLGNLQASLMVNTVGQSGHAYHPHYVDEPDLWRNIQYHAMNWERSAVEADAEGHLKLTP